MSYAHTTYPENREHALSLWRGNVVPEVTPTYLSLWRGSLLITHRADSMAGTLKDVAARTGVSVREITGTGREARIVWARAEACWLMRQVREMRVMRRRTDARDTLQEVTKYSFPQIAQALGGIHHTSAMYLCQKWQSHIDGKPTPRIERHRKRAVEYHHKRKARKAVAA